MALETKTVDQPKEDLLISLGQDCCNKWFDKSEEGIVDILIYPVIGIDINQLRELIKLNWPTQDSNLQGLVAAVDFGNLKLLYCNPEVRVHYENPKICAPAESIREKEFQGPAVLLAKPLNDQANTILTSIIAPLFRLHRGSARTGSERGQA